MAPMVNVPTPTMVAVWPAVKLPVTPAMVKPVTLSGVSASLSLVSTLPVATLSSARVPVSAVITLEALTDVMVVVVWLPVSSVVGVAVKSGPLVAKPMVGSTRAAVASSITEL
ncbi:hypothetical protein D3C76_1304890 [compost metagenome]